MVPLSAVLVLVLMTGPPALGQTLSVVNAVLPVGDTTVQIMAVPPEAPVPVDAGNVALPVQVTYSYMSGLPTFNPTRVSLFVADAPPWLVATVSPSTLYMPVAMGPSCACYQQVTASAFLLLSATHDAPAFTQGIVRLQAWAEPNEMYAASYADFQLPLQAGFFALTDVRAAANHVALEAGREGGVPLTVTNHGNAPIRVTFEVLEAPQGVSVTPPDALVVGSRQHGEQDNSATAPLALRADGGFREGDVVLVARTTYALDPKRAGDHTKVTIHVARGSGSGGDVVTQSLGLSASDGIAVQMGLAVAGLAGTVLWMRHRKLR